MRRDPGLCAELAAVGCDDRGARGGRRGAVTVEYLLLVTLVGIGVLVGLAAVRNALVQELDDVADAISEIVV